MSVIMTLNSSQLPNQNFLSEEWSELDYSSNPNMIHGSEELGYSCLEVPSPVCANTNSNVISFPACDETLQFRSRHDSYSSSIYSPGPSSHNTQHVDTLQFESAQIFDYETSNEGTFQEHAISSNPMSNQSSSSKKPKEKC